MRPSSPHLVDRPPSGKQILSFALHMTAAFGPRVLARFVARLPPAPPFAHHQGEWPISPCPGQAGSAVNLSTSVHIPSLRVHQTRHFQPLQRQLTMPLCCNMHAVLESQQAGCASHEKRCGRIPSRNTPHASSNDVSPAPTRLQLPWPEHAESASTAIHQVQPIPLRYPGLQVQSIVSVGSSCCLPQQVTSL